MKRDSIKMPIIFPISAIALFFLLIIITNIQDKNIVVVNRETNVDSVEITGYEGYGSGRGGIFYKKDHCISTSAKLIENNCGFNSWKSNGPIIDLNNKPHEYTLDDLGLPYVVYKRANSDTLHIKKDGCVLKFLLR